MKKYLCLFLAVLSSFADAQTKNSTKLFSDFADKFITEALDSLGVAALSIAIVKSDEAVYLRGFGHSDTMENTKTNSETLFYIASCTKSFTGLAAALLDSKGLVRLDEPLIHFFPELKFDTALKADSITLRHLLTHTSGIQNDGIVFRTAYSGEYTFDQLVQLIPTSEVNKVGFGNFEYDNIGYNIYSFVLMKALGRKWQDELSNVVFDPLKMTKTTAYVSRIHEKNWEIARPYFIFGTNGPEKISLEKTDALMHAAGGTYSNAQDLTKWLRIQMSGGMLDGKQIFPDSVIRETHRLQAVASSDFGPFKRIGYGLGWYIGLYGNDTLIHHFGGFPGYQAHISFMPEKKIGVAILVNEAAVGGRLADLLSTCFYDWWLGKSNVEADYKQKLKKLILQKKQMSEKITNDRAQRALRKWQFSVPIEKLTGAYEHPSYGKFIVNGTVDSFSIRIADLSCVASSFKNPNSVRVELIPGQGEVITFKISDGGQVLSLQYTGKVFMKID